MAQQQRALIVGVGAGLSAALARKCSRLGMRVALAARDTRKLAALAAETGATTIACDATSRSDVERLFATLDEDAAEAGAGLDLVVYNASGRAGGAFTEIDPDAALRALAVTAFGGFLIAQEAARRMLAQGHGTILLTGASASIKGYPRSAVFAMGKFALRGLAQSLARELQPQNIHVAHIVIDGGILKADDPRQAERGQDGLLEPEAIADTYLALHAQHRTAWTSEIELRPWVEKF
jgi:NAD(P)-dependent dehydrogenase (short-subunit alcohol dehydrogenase family)